MSSGVMVYSRFETMEEGVGGVSLHAFQEASSALPAGSGDFDRFRVAGGEAASDCEVVSSAVSPDGSRDASALSSC